MPGLADALVFDDAVAAGWQVDGPTATPEGGLTIVLTHAVSGPEELVRAAEQAADDLRKTGKITGDLVFTVDASATELAVDAELAPVEEA